MSGPIYRGVKFIDNVPHCEECGADLTVDENTKFVAHMDGKKEYRNVFNCCKCGHVITASYERTDPWW